MSTAVEKLSPADQYVLDQYEGIIERGLKTFVAVGKALWAIRDRRLYRGTHATFEAYCEARWGMKRSYAHRTIEAAKIVSEDLLPIGNITDEQSSAPIQLPANEAQVRPLAALPPEDRRGAWQQAVDTAPQGRVTATHVKQTVDTVQVGARLDDQQLLRLFPLLQSPSQSQVKRVALALSAGHEVLHKYEPAIQVGLVVAWLPSSQRHGHCQTLQGALAYAEQWPQSVEGIQVGLWANPERACLPGLPPWPKYTGMRPGGPGECGYLRNEKDQDPLAKIPVFTEAEWEELAAFDAVKVLSSTFPELDWSEHHQGLRTVRPSAEDRRIYDPAYGRCILPTTCHECAEHFIRRGWGEWTIVRFNDGTGGRTERRYFEHDWYGRRLIEPARATVDPACFSEWQYKRLAIHGDIRSREAAIAALREDLAALESEEYLSTDAIQERLLDLLQGLTLSLHDSSYTRDGRASIEVTSDGMMDAVKYKARLQAEEALDYKKRREYQFQPEHATWLRPDRRMPK